MKRTILLISISVLALISCRPGNIIPRDKMSDIYYDFYMADRYLHDTQNNNLGDSVKVYIPIIEKHGYTFDEYQASVNYYLHKPEELTRMFKDAEQRIRDRRDYLENALSQLRNINKRWMLLDSLDIYGNPESLGNAYYRAIRLLFFKPDTLDVTSPTIDSIILNHINSAYFLYDSLPELYNKIKLIEFMEESEQTDSLIKADTQENALTITSKPVIKKVEEPESVNLLDEDEMEERRSEERLKQFEKVEKNDKKKNRR